MSEDAVRRLRRRLGQRPRDTDAAFDLAQAAHTTGQEELALPLVEQAAALARDPVLWQWVGVLLQACDRSDTAAAAYACVLDLVPGDAKALHGVARATLEAGHPAVEAFEIARAAAPLDAQVLSGLALAQQAEGETDAAIAGLDAVLAIHPGWYDGHEFAAQLRWLRGDGDAFAASVDRALAVAPGDAMLWSLRIDLELRAERYDAAHAVAERATEAVGAQGFVTLARATIASERGDTAVADALFAALGPVDDEALAVRRIRHELRSGRVDAAAAIGESARAKPYARSVWPYLGLAWRLLGGRRAQWLDGPALVATVDLRDYGVDPDALAVVLRRLHRTSGQQFDQSVRGGTQTAGHLFKRAEPEIVALRAAVVAAVARYVAELPPRDQAHPVLDQRRDRAVRFAGAWSVRLTHGGHHRSHVHPAGWLSSAIYLAVAPERGAQMHDGWLAIGAPPPELRLALEPSRMVEPVVGRLVLFPSVAWHATLPFAGGERMTAAFDVALPGSR